MSFQTKRVRTKVYCYCKKCNGSLVDPRTKKRHIISKRINYEEPRPSDEIDDIEMDFNEIDDNAMEHDPPVTERDYNFLTKKLPINESEKSLIIKKEKFLIELSKIYYWMRMIMIRILMIEIPMKIPKTTKKTMTMRRSTLRHQILILMS